MLADKGAAVGCAQGVRRGGLLIGLAGRGAAAVGLIAAASLRLAVPMRRAAFVGLQAAASLVFAARGRAVAMGPGRFGRGVTIVKALRRVEVSPARSLAGPGQSVGEVVQALPAALLAFVLPVGYIGRKLAALAVARGEGAVVVGNALIVGGRVVIEPSGVPVFVGQGGEVKAVRALALEAGHIGEGVTLAAGQVRDAWLSEQRTAAASYVRKYAKAAAKIEDDGRRAAALADLRYVELRA